MWFSFFVRYKFFFVESNLLLSYLHESVTVRLLTRDSRIFLLRKVGGGGSKCACVRVFVQLCLCVCRCVARCLQVLAGVFRWPVRVLRRVPACSDIFFLFVNIFCHFYFRYYMFTLGVVTKFASFVFILLAYKCYHAPASRLAPTQNAVDLKVFPNSEIHHSDVVIKNENASINL